ncbi:MAG TPA: 2-dehydropantoate 2-reductase [Kofleriaceae bacterium]|nr:2-dehydropantoate 2-reductase [Kofleriaceae bacterium]
MQSRPRIGIMGAGAVGCYVGGRLAAAGAAEIVMVGRARQQQELLDHGLTLRDVDGATITVAADQLGFATDASALAECDAVLCCVKSAQTEEVAGQLAGSLGPGAIVASLQNGVRNADTLRAGLPGREVLAAIVGFNVVGHGDGVFQRATNWPLSFEAGQSPRARALMAALRAAGLEVDVHANLAPHQWTKLVVNLNNAVSALSGVPTRELILSPAYRRIIAALVDEALTVLDAAGIRPARLRGVPLRLMSRIMRLPTPIVRLVTRAQMRIDPEARSSMWQDLSRRRPTEVDYLNGEVVRLAGAHNASAPLNRRIVELIHAAETENVGPPDLTAVALWTQLSSPG